jgi:hypothetical protein
MSKGKKKMDLMKKAVNPLISLIFLNYVAFAVLISVNETKWLRSNKSEKINISAVEYHFVEDDDTLSARNYADLARSFVERYSKTDIHECRHYAVATFDVYQNLIKKNGREELSDKIRFGSTIDTSDDGHIALQIYENEDWVNYETLWFTKPYLSFKNVKEYSKTDDQRDQIESDKDFEIFSWGETKFMFQSAESILKRGGLVGAVWRAHGRYRGRQKEAKYQASLE